MTAGILGGEVESDVEVEKGENLGVGEKACRIDVRKRFSDTGNILTTSSWTTCCICRPCVPHIREQGFLRSMLLRLWLCPELQAY